MQLPRPLTRLILAAFCLGLTPAAAGARNIVLTNDDGLTSNVVALYKELKAQGHDVIVSVPCRNQSGMGAAIEISRALGPLVGGCRSHAARPGMPGAGPMDRPEVPAADFFYVDSTPNMALLYGLDVLSVRRWGRSPDLVLSGPNEGQNVGSIVISSGTVSNAQLAGLRGIPAIALSAGIGTVDDAGLANPGSIAVANRIGDLLGILAGHAGRGPILPPHVVLNVNFPDHLEGARWRLTRLGTANDLTVRFVENVARDSGPAERAMAAAHGLALPELPGLAIARAVPAAVNPAEADNEAIVVRQDIAVTPLQAGYEAPAADRARLVPLIRRMFDNRGRPARRAR